MGSLVNGSLSVTKLENIPEIFSYKFEEIDQSFWIKFTNDNKFLALYSSAVYIWTIFWLQNVMKSRRGFELKGFLFLWNFSLGIMSFVGFARTFPELLSVLQESEGFYKSVCSKNAGFDKLPTFRYWAWIFALSKFVELGDTILIVLRKRPLVFLQWYHHALTLTVVWLVAPLVEPIARWTLVTNFGVHALMYPYFALKTVGVRIPAPVANAITTLQFVQMVIGCVANVATIYYLQSARGCYRYPISIAVNAIIYGSFVILFGKLFLKSVLSRGHANKSKLT